MKIQTLSSKERSYEQFDINGKKYFCTIERDNGEVTSIRADVGMMTHIDGAPEDIETFSVLGTIIYQHDTVSLIRFALDTDTATLVSEFAEIVDILESRTKDIDNEKDTL